MAREWTAPVAVIEQFMANDYVAACWTLHCDLPTGCVYFETNGQEGIQVWGGDGSGITADSESYGGYSFHQYSSNYSSCGSAFTIRVNGNNALLPNGTFFSNSDMNPISTQFSKYADRNAAIQGKGQGAYVHIFQETRYEYDWWGNVVGSYTVENHHVGLLKNATRSGNHS